MRYLAALLLPTLAAVVLLLPACSPLHGDTSLFTSDVKQLDFTFEYAKDLEITPLERYPDLIAFNVVHLDASLESPLGMPVSVWSDLGAGAEADAKRRIDQQLSFHESQPSNERNFVLLRHDRVGLDASTGYRLECTVDVLPPRDVRRADPTSTDPYIHERTLRISIPRGGRVYEIDISASQDEWSRREKDIQHILDTFRWR